MSRRESGFTLIGPLIALAIATTSAVAAPILGPDEPPETALDQKVTLSIKVTSLSDLCKLLTEISGVEFGTRGDVGDRKVTLFVSDERLGDVAKGIAEVSHLYLGWVKEGREDGRYVFYEDDRRRAAREGLVARDADQARAKLERKTSEALDRYLALLAVPPESDVWEEVKRDAPWVYLGLVLNKYAERSAVAFISLLSADERGAIAQGTPYRAPVSSLAPEARELVWQTCKLDRLPSEKAETWDTLFQAAWLTIKASGEGIAFTLHAGDESVDSGEVIRPLGLYPDEAAEIIIAEGADPERAVATHLARRRADASARAEQQWRDTKSELYRAYEDDPHLWEKTVWPAEDLRPGATLRLPDVLEMVGRKCEDLPIYAQHFTHKPVTLRRASTAEPLAIFLWRLGSQYGVEFERAERGLHVVYSHWARRLESEIPEGLLRTWAERVEETGRLDLGDLAQVAASLSDAQVRSLAGSEELIWQTHALRCDRRVLEALRLFASPSPAERDTARTGISFETISPESQRLLENVVAALGPDAEQGFDPVAARYQVACEPVGANLKRMPEDADHVTIKVTWAQGRASILHIYVAAERGRLGQEGV